MKNNIIAAFAVLALLGACKKTQKADANSTILAKDTNKREVMMPKEERDNSFTLVHAFAEHAELKGNGKLYAVIHTSMGKMVAELYEKETPQTVANFVGLSLGTRSWTHPQTQQKTKQPLYQNVLCHRVIPDFMIQCGDPIGNGTGGPGYTFDDEFNPSLKHNKPGILSMANRGPHTNGSQFFITEVPTPHLDNRHTVFGLVIKNVELVSKIARVKTGFRDRPVDDVVIQKIDIVRSEQVPE